MSVENKKNKNLPQIISLFCGAGGLDLGFVQAGYKVALAIDYEMAAINTHRKNFNTTKSLQCDLTVLGPEGVLKLVRKELRKGSRIGLIGGPPCQGFSRSNPSSDVDDPRNLLPLLYVNIIQELQKVYHVEFVVFENVLGMKDKKHASKYKSLILGLKRLHFDVTEKELCALDYGVPQKRNRIIISAMRSQQGYGEVVPAKTTGQTTVREAIGALTEPTFFNRSLTAKDIPFHPNHWTMNPKSKKFSDPSLQTNGNRSFRKLAWDKAAPTIAFGNREIHLHPDGRRRLSIYEAMLLQGFPTNFVLEGNFSQQVLQISNAVPPPLAFSVANAVANSMNFK